MSEELNPRGMQELNDAINTPRSAINNTPVQIIVTVSRDGRHPSVIAERVFAAVFGSVSTDVGVEVLSPGTDHDINCTSCQRERAQGMTPDIKTS